MSTALHFDPIRVTQELEAEGFEHRQAVALANVIRNHVLGPVNEGRDEDADAAVAAITQTERRLEATIDSVETRLNDRITGVETRLGARIDGVQAEVSEVRQEVRDLRHEMAIAIRDGVDRAAERAEATSARQAARTNMWIGLATAFLGLLIGAAAILPAVAGFFQ